jgi:Domain of unknown function (DUF4159)
MLAIMKKAKVLLALAVIVVGSLVAAHVIADTPPDPDPEFFFTRLAYSENGYRGWGRFVPKNFRCPEFGGGNFFPAQGVGWSMDSPGADCKYMGGIQRLTNLKVYPNPNMIRITDPDLFKYPYAYMVEPGGLDMTDDEVRILREYLLRGGFLHADDFWGLREKANFEYEMRRVLPEYRMEVLPLTHEVFHTFYDIDQIIQIPGERAGCYGGPTFESYDDRDPRIYGISDDTGRLLVVVTYNSDLGDAWEYMDEKCYPEKYSGQAYRLGMNFIVYAMSH